MENRNNKKKWFVSKARKFFGIILIFIGIIGLFLPFLQGIAMIIAGIGLIGGRPAIQRCKHFIMRLYLKIRHVWR
jgi:hypothetical protein